MDSPPLRVSMHVTMKGDVWLELDGKRVSSDEAQRLAEVLTDVAAAAESLKRRKDPPATNGQTDASTALPSAWPDDRGRGGEMPRHTGQQPAVRPGPNA